MISALIGAVVAFGSYQVDMANVQTKREANYRQRIESLESRLDALQAKLIARSSELAILKAQIQVGGDPMSALFDYIDGIESPAWIKVWVPSESEFHMLWINDAYEDRYGVSREYYIGSSDDAVFPSDIVEQYRESDMRVFQRKQFLQTNEPTLEGDSIFWKWYVPLPGGRDGVAGLQIR